ncbi:integrator complex subunit 14 isoform X2 [Teleopsis dalmanni]|nr:integrator complex subunit 14 isoform X2 [Teleopsis dalmanni]
MQCSIPGRSEENILTYHQLASKAISQLLEYLTNNSKLEHVALVCFSAVAELKVDFTRDYELIRQAVKKVEIATKSNALGLLQFLGPLIQNNWGLQNYCHIVLFTDCPIGFPDNLLQNYIQLKSKTDKKDPWMEMLQKTKINLVGMGVSSNKKFMHSLDVYKKLFEVCNLKFQIFTPKHTKDLNKDECDPKVSRTSSQPFGTNLPHTSHKSELGRTSMFEMIDRLCEINFRPMEALLKCGGYFRLECPVTLWPPFPSYYGIDIDRHLSHKLEVCGYLSLLEIGSPASVSRHVILPKLDKRRDKLVLFKGKYEFPPPLNDLEGLENDMRNFYLKDDDCIDDAEAFKLGAPNLSPPTEKESLIVLLHNALKSENLGALVLLNNNWYGFIFACSDSKKKSSLLLNVLPPGNNVIPWLGDLRSLCISDDPQTNEATCSYSAKSEKRSYSQNCVVWIRQSSLHSDVQKVLRHAKKMPEKTQHFFKELNRIRRAALSFGFIELLEAMALLFEKECEQIPVNTNPECVIQLKHAAAELRKPANLDLKITIFPAATLAEVNAINSNALTVNAGAVTSNFVFRDGS